MDFDTLHLLVTTQWADAQENLDQFLARLQHFLDGIASLSETQAIKLRECVPVVLGKVMSSNKVWNNKVLVTLTNELISTYFKLLISEFVARPNESLESIVEVFKGENFFGLRGSLPFPPPEGMEGSFAITNDASNYHIAAQVNLLGESGLFDYIWNILSATETPTIKFMKNSLSLLSFIRRVLKPKLLYDYCIMFRDRIYAIFMGLEEEQLKTVTKQDVSQIVGYVESIMKRVFHNIRTSEELEIETQQTKISDKFCNDFALKCFKSTFFEKRIHGIVYIEDAVRDRFMAKKKVSIGFILEHRIIEMLFDLKTTRDELIIKGKPIIKYVMEEGKISDEMIDLIWACTKDKYLSIACFDIFINLIGHATNYTTKVWAKLCTLQPSEWTEHLIGCVHKMVEYDQMYNRLTSKIETTKAAELYSTIIKGSPSVDVITLAMDKMIGLMKQTSGCIRLCESLLASKDSDANEVCYLLKGLLDPGNMYLAQHKGHVRELLDRYQTLDTMLLTLCGYKAEIGDTLLQTYVESGDASTAMEKVYLGKFSHKFALFHRLRFIQNCLDWKPKKDRTLTEEQIEMLGHNFLHPDRSIPAEREIVFEWLQKLCSPTVLLSYQRNSLGAKLHLQSAAILQIFERWLCQEKNFPATSMKGAECFQTYFAAVNLESLSIRPDHFNTLNGSNFICLDFNYKALKHLYRLFCVADSNDVFSFGKSVLLKLFTKFNESVKPKLTTIWNQILQLIFDAMEQALNQPEDEQNIRLINRSIIILKQFLDATKNHPELEKVDKPKSQVTQQHVPDTRHTPLAHEVSGVQTLVEICALTPEIALLVLRHFHHNVEACVDAVFVRGPSFLEPFERQLHSVPKTEAAQAPEPVVQQDYIPPSSLLSNDQQKFNLLLRLLEVPAANKPAIWELVNGLPPNKDLFDTLQNLENPKFEVLFDLKHVFKFLYILQIIDGLMAPSKQNQTEASIVQSKAWSRKFFHAKGFEYLYEMMQRLDISQNTIRSGAYKQCLIFLLKIVNHFLLGTFKKPPTQDKKSLALSQGSSEKIVKVIDFSQLISTLLMLIWNIMNENSSELSSEETQVNREVVTLSISLLANNLHTQPKLFKIFYEFDQVPVEKYILFALTKCPKEISQAWVTGLSSICSDTRLGAVDPHPTFFLSDLLIKNYPWKETVPLSFFELLSQLLQQKAKLKLDEEANTQPDAFITQILELISTCPGDKSERSPDADTTLTGSMLVVTAYLQAYPSQKKELGHSLLKQIFDFCVLPQDGTMGTIKCLTPQTRRVAFDLLLELTVDRNDLQMELLNLIAPAARIPTKDETNKISSLPRTKTCKYVGLLNTGVTCYANSLMQQFYMIPELRQGIFNVKLLEPAADEEPKKIPPLVPEVIKMFSNLQESQKEFYETVEFMKSVSDVFDIKAQQDTYEFYNVVCDRMEKELQGTNQELLLDHVFKAELQREIICPQNHKITGQEFIQNLSVEILNLSNLYDALDGYFEGEKIQGFKCDECREGVEITKQFSIKKVPKTLLIHLKRFQFDVESLSRKKISDRFVYPTELDISKYLTADVKDKYTEDETKYGLVGVIVHKGTADHGHYYSFIKDRTTNLWSKFDDGRISEFDPKNLDKETFGGEQQQQHHQHHNHIYTCGGWRQAHHHQHESTGTNAYILVYEQNTSKNAWTSPEKLASIKAPQQIVDAIKMENINSSKLRLKFDPLYFEFYKNILHKISFDPISEYREDDFYLSTIQKATRYVFDTVEKNQEALWTSWMDTLSNVYSKHLPACKWFLSVLLPPQTDWLMRNLINSQHLYVRRSFANLLMKCIETLDPVEQQLKEQSTNEVFGDNASLQQQLLSFQFQLFAKKPKTRQLLLAILKKILDNEADVQSRIICTKTPLFQENIERVDGALNFLIAVGFKQDKIQSKTRGPVIWNYDVDHDRFKAAITLLESQPEEDKPMKVAKQLDLQSLMKVKVNFLFFKHLISIMEEARAQWKTFHQYWSIFERSIQVSHHIRAFLAEKELHLKVLDQYMGNSSPIWKTAHPGKPRTNLSASTTGCYLTEMMNTLAHMVRACHTDATQDAGTQLPSTGYPGSPLLPQNLSVRNYIFCDSPPVTNSLLTAEFSPNANKLMFAHYAWEDWSRTKAIITYVQAARQREIARGASVYEGLLELQDSLAKNRVAYIFNTRLGLFQELEFHSTQVTLLRDIGNWLKIPNVAGFLEMPASKKRLTAILENFQKHIDRLLQLNKGHAEVAILEPIQKFLSGESCDYTVDTYPEDFQMFD